MYSWKEIALKYKDEISTLRSEIFDSFSILDSKSPNSHTKAHSILENSIRMSDENVNFIEESESKADKRIIEKNGGTFPSRNLLKIDDFEKISDLCMENFPDKELAYIIPEKIALYCSYSYLKAKGFDVSPTTSKDIYLYFAKNKDNTLSVIDKVTGIESKIKVLVSGMEFLGKTCSILNDKRDIEVSKQHTYLFDLNEVVSDRYFFANFNNKGKSLVLYSWIKGKVLRKMLVHPLRDRFVGKRACILQKEGILNKLPYSIDDIAKRNMYKT